MSLCVTVGPFISKWSLSSPPPPLSGQDDIDGRIEDRQAKDLISIERATISEIRSKIGPTMRVDLNSFQPQQHRQQLQLSISVPGLIYFFFKREDVGFWYKWSKATLGPTQLLLSLSKMIRHSAVRITFWQNFVQLNFQQTTVHCLVSFSLAGGNGVVIPNSRDITDNKSRINSSKTSTTAFRCSDRRRFDWTRTSRSVYTTLNNNNNNSNKNNNLFI